MQMLGGVRLHPLVDEQEEWIMQDAKYRLLAQASRSQADPAHRYQLQEELGRGGAGTVYRAFDRVTRRTVALKVLRSTSPDEETLQRFLVETEISSRLEHPGIIPVYDAGTLSDGRPFYTMREVSPRALSAVMSRADPSQGLSLHRLCGIFIQICNALAYAHSQSIIHRDIKPENILLGRYGEVYITDWGISKDLNRPTQFTYTQAPRESPGLALTEEGFIIGTPGYMSPEQITTEQGLDHRTDLFSLGVILYELLTGRSPFIGSSSQDTLLRTLRRTPECPGALVPDCPPVLDEICMSLLSKSREERPQGAELVVAAIEFFLEEQREGEKRGDEAERFSREARIQAQRALQLSQEHDRLKALSCDEEQPSWAQVAKQRREARLKEELVLALSRASDLYLQALAHDTESEGIKQQLVELSMLQADLAAEDNKEDLRLFHQQKALQYAPTNATESTERR